MTMMIMMIIITFCALDILILEFLPCKWQLVWNMLIKIIFKKKMNLIASKLKELLLALNQLDIKLTKMEQDSFIVIVLFVE